jgi:SAM-dependent methyltransferase
MNLTYSYLDPELIAHTGDFRVAEAFLRGTGRRNVGWHYIIDLTWIYAHARRWPAGLRVLDAGGGRGPAQFLLAEMGFDVTNIDLMHTPPGIAFQRRYGLAAEVLASHVATPYSRHVLAFGSLWRVVRSARKSLLESAMLRESTARRYAVRHERWRAAHGFTTRPVGHIRWLAGNLCAMPELASGSFDAVVSLSALEHIPGEHLPAAISEIERVVRPGGKWAVTTSGTERAGTWYHVPSQGYCFSQDDLGRLFGARPLNDASPADILGKYRDSRYLKENLAFQYRLSGKNGMPWGRWNPSYVPVGLARRHDLT